jgi:N-acetylmuramoyl-L-alanine amidase/phosphatidylserine/phosphatidylglycerophosphate/cardiolipin synthase-like enzyme
MSPTVVIDPGHGGSAAVGGSSPNNATGPNGLLEKDVTLDLGQRVATLLGNRAQVILTRAGDVNRSLSDRAKTAHDANADIFVSIHMNGWSDPSVDGSEAWVAKNGSAASRGLARALLDRVLTVTQVRDRGVREEDFGVLLPSRHAAATAASLIEVAFLTNPDEADRLARDDYRQQLAQAICGAIDSRLPVQAPAPPPPAQPPVQAPVTQSLSFTPAPGAGTIFLAPNTSPDYTDYIQPATRGDLQPLINGRSSNPAVDRTEPLDEMQAAVAATASGDSVYLASWYFEPRTPLTGGAYGAVKTWGGFLAAKAAEGVKVRILQTDFDSIAKGSYSNVRLWMARMDSYISRLPAGMQDNLQYVVSLHPATFGAVRSVFAGRSSVHIGSHHQKFMVVKRGGETIAFCGGLDIETRKTPPYWSYGGLAAWHDIHVKLRGPIARDLEKEFALRWNREKGASTVAPSPNPWSAYDTLPAPSAPVEGDTDAAAERQRQDVQMERTVSSDATFSAFTTNQDNVKQIYHNIVGAAQNFLYLENQYFRVLDLADWIVAQGQANPSLVAIFVVVFSAATDDGDDEVTQQGTYLQHEFFDRVVKALGSRAAIYTMAGRAVHSKFALADDRYMTIGSANANDRSFELDSELNVAVDDAELTSAFRRRLWAHNLGVAEATVAAWSTADFIPQWDVVAAANAALAIPSMSGEGVVRWDYTTATGTSHPLIPNYLAETDADRGDGPDRAGVAIADTTPDGDEGGTALA